MSQSIQLTRHAREQIQMRGIFESEIVQVLNSRAQIVQNPRDSTLLETFTEMKGKGRQFLLVSFRQYPTSILIITVTFARPEQLRMEGFEIP